MENGPPSSFVWAAANRSTLGPTSSGRTSRRLIKCFGRAIRDAASEGKARYPDIKMNFRTPGVKGFTFDM
jgi:hypothetical protein